MQLSYPKIGKGPTMRSLIGRAKAVYKRDHPVYTRAYGGGGGHSEERAQIRLESDLEYRAFQKQKDIATFDQNERKMQATERKQSLDRNKELVYKSIELLNIAKANGNMALQKNIIAGMEGYLRALDPHMQSLIAPIIQSGPFSPEATKMRKWDEHNPMPQDFRRVDPNLNPEMYANAWSDWQGWHEARELFRTGKAPHKRQFGRINKDLAVVRTKDGAMVMSDEDMQLDAMAKKYDVPLGQMLLEGGVRGRPITVEQDGQKVVRRFNVDLSGNRTIELVSQDPKKGTEEGGVWAATFEMWDDLNSDEQKKAKFSTIAQAKAFIDTGPEKERDQRVREYSDKYFKPAHGGNFIVRKDGTTAVVFGERDILENYHVIINSQGRVFTEHGEDLGPYETAAESLRFRTEVMESQRVEKEREMKARGGAVRRGRVGGALRMIEEKKRNEHGSSGVSGSWE